MEYREETLMAEAVSEEGRLPGIEGAVVGASSQGFSPHCTCTDDPITVVSLVSGCLNSHRFPCQALTKISISTQGQALRLNYPKESSAGEPHLKTCGVNTGIIQITNFLKILTTELTAWAGRSRAAFPLGWGLQAGPFCAVQALSSTWPVWGRTTTLAGFASCHHFSRFDYAGNTHGDRLINSEEGV